MTSYGAMASMITGGLTVIIWPLLSNISDASIFKLYELAPAFVFAIAAAVIVSLITKNKDQGSIERFDRAMAILNPK
jgi:Na+/proline symporter